MGRFLAGLLLASTPIIAALTVGPEAARQGSTGGSSAIGCFVLILAGSVLSSMLIAYVVWFT